MTIEVQISNHDKSRAIEVVEIEINKQTGARTEGVPYRLAPGTSRTWAAYLLRDILVREVDPNG